MKNKFYLVFNSITALMVFLSCQKEIPQKIQEAEIPPQEYQAALNLVRNFHQQNNLSKASSEMKILDVQKETINFKRRTTAKASELNHPDTIGPVELYKFAFETNNQKGFAISSADNRINRVLVYVKNGSISDTIHIKGMAQMIRNLPLVCAEDLDYYYNYAKTKQTRAIERDIVQPFIKTQWEQSAPYNNQLDMCSDGKRKPAGCVAIAVAQCIVHMGSDYWNTGYNLESFKRNPKIYIWDSPSLVDSTSKFVKAVGIGCQTNYGCTGSGSTLAKASTYLSTIEIQTGKLFYYRSQTDVNKSDLYWALAMKRPVISSGSTSSSGHAWIFDGVEADLNRSKVIRIYTIHCNWGWGGYCDGWYASYNTPVDQTTLVPQGGPYNRNNSYIYFKWYRL